MKWLKQLLFALVMGGLLLAAPTTWAQQSLSINPTSGPSGTVVTLSVSNANFIYECSANGSVFVSNQPGSTASYTVNQLSGSITFTCIVQPNSGDTAAGTNNATFTVTAPQIQVPQTGPGDIQLPQPNNPNIQPIQPNQPQPDDAQPPQPDDVQPPPPPQDNGPGPVFADADDDGVQDSADRCPFVSGRGDRYGGVNGTDGCPVDSDGDGVNDGLDPCPFAAGPPANDGCPADDGAPPPQVPTTAPQDDPPPVVLPVLPDDGLCYVATPSTGGVNVREEATTNSSIVGVLDFQLIYEAAFATDNAAGERWYAISLDATTNGFVRSDVVRTTPACDDLQTSGQTFAGNTGSLSPTATPDVDYTFIPEPGYYLFTVRGFRPDCFGEYQPGTPDDFEFRYFIETDEGLVTMDLDDGAIRRLYDRVPTDPGENEQYRFRIDDQQETLYADRMERALLDNGVCTSDVIYDYVKLSNATTPAELAAASGLPLIPEEGFYNYIRFGGAPFYMQYCDIPALRLESVDDNLGFGELYTLYSKPWPCDHLSDYLNVTGAPEVPTPIESELLTQSCVGFARGSGLYVQLGAGAGRTDIDNSHLTTRSALAERARRSLDSLCDAIPYAAILESDDTCSSSFPDANDPYQRGIFRVQAGPNPATISLTLTDEPTRLLRLLPGEDAYEYRDDRLWLVLHNTPSGYALARYSLLDADTCSEVIVMEVTNVSGGGGDDGGVGQANNNDTGGTSGPSDGASGDREWTGPTTLVGAGCPGAESWVNPSDPDQGDIDLTLRFTENGILVSYPSLSNILFTPTGEAERQFAGEWEVPLQSGTQYWRGVLTFEPDLETAVYEVYVKNDASNATCYGSAGARQYQISVAR